MRFGVHVSISGSMERAVLRAAAMGCETMQIFSSNPRIWMGTPIDPAAVEGFRTAATEKNIWPVFLHTPYLVNLAATDELILRKSRETVMGALVLAGMLGAKYVVTHVGSFRGATLDSGIDTVVKSLSIILGSTGNGATMLLENSSGGGSGIGGTFEDLRDILTALPEFEPRLGVCLDTAHLWGAGYDISTAEGVDATLLSFADRVGISRLQLIHANDSSVKLNSRRDVHRPPGKGLIGVDAFTAMVKDPRLQEIPFILETRTEDPVAAAKELELMRSLRSR